MIQEGLMADTVSELGLERWPGERQKDTPGKGMMLLKHKKTFFLRVVTQLA